MSYIIEKGRIDHLIFYFYQPNLAIYVIFATYYCRHCCATV